MGEAHSNNDCEVIAKTVVRNSAGAGEKDKVKREDNPEDDVTCQANNDSSEAGHEEPQELFRVQKPVNK